MIRFVANYETTVGFASHAAALFHRTLTAYKVGNRFFAPFPRLG